MKNKIPVYRPSLSGNEKKYILDCLDSSWISSKGEYIKKFEDGFSQYLGIKHATTVANGTLALHLALIALGVGQDDEVIVPTFTYIASVNCISYTGATPVFVDSLEATWQMNPEDIERKITPKTKAILVVHLYGHPCDMDAICAIAKKHQIFVVEDCAEAIGSKYKGRYVGTFGDIAAFSFFGNKTITTGEGGMVVTNDETLYDRAVHYKGQGLAKYREYWHDVIGYNFRMTNMCAAIGLAQLERVEEFLQKKHSIAKQYQEGMKGLPLIVHSETENVFHSYWMISILVETPNIRDQVRTYLAEHGVETRPTFYPVHTMPMYSKRYERYVVAESLGWRGINLPSWPDLAEADLNFIIETLRAYPW
jgi:perosamine synthetase